MSYKLSIDGKTEEYLMYSLMVILGFVIIVSEMMSKVELNLVNILSFSGGAMLLGAGSVLLYYSLKAGIESIIMRAIKEVKKEKKK